MRMLVALIAVSVLALVGASPAMADENNCPGGSIIGGSHDDVKILVALRALSLARRLAVTSRLNPVTVS